MACEDETVEVLKDPSQAAALADTSRAVILARGTLAARQRLGAARARVRMAELNNEDPEEIAAARAELAPLEEKAGAAEKRFEEADTRKPQADADGATLYGQTTPRPAEISEALPLTAALISETGEVLSTVAVDDTGAFSLKAAGTVKARVQVSDSAQAVLFREAKVTELRAGTIEFRDVALDKAKPTPTPPPTVLTMPDLSNQSEAAACALLARIGIADIKIIDAPNSSTPGLVVGQTPDAGTVLKDGQQVSLTVGRAGDGDDVVRLPDFVGELASVAQERAANLGVETELQTDESSKSAPDTVVAQSEPKGTPVRSIDLLTLTIAPPKKSGRVEVPDVLGLERKQAVEVLRRVGLRDVISEVRLPGKLNTVIEQAPGKDEHVLPRSTVTLFLGGGIRDGDKSTPAPNDPDKTPTEPDKPSRVPPYSDNAPTGTVKPAAAPTNAGKVSTGTVKPAASPYADKAATGSDKPAPAPREPVKARARSVNPGDPGSTTYRKKLSRAMREDDRFESLEMTPARLTRTLGQLDVSDEESAKAILDMKPAYIRQKTALNSMKAVTQLKLLVRSGLSRLG